MTQDERRSYLINELIKENAQYSNLQIPDDSRKQSELLRGLMNVRPAAEVSDEFELIQDEYLREENRRRGITDISELTPVKPGIYLRKGDITTLSCDAIVNAANSGMTGCYIPNHHCIDNCIHSYAGTGLRLACAKMMRRQGYEEPAGRAKITPAFSLPCRYVLHTVGPIISGRVREEDRQTLKSCYISCLELAEENDVKSIAFCCISTGVFHYPKDEAAKVAVDTVLDYKQQHNSDIKIIFNVFGGEDYDIYSRLLRH